VAASITAAAVVTTTRAVVVALLLLALALTGTVFLRLHAVPAAPKGSERGQTDCPECVHGIAAVGRIGELPDRRVEPTVGRGQGIV